MSNLYKNIRGFTLVELSIVLVIVGLLVSAVLTGQSLIRAAKARSTAAQINSIDTAINVFWGKYNSIPGDTPYATDYGLAPTGVTPENGNGDLIISDTEGKGGLFDLELIQFWVHLSGAKLISLNPTGVLGNGQLGVDYPETELGKGGLMPKPGLSSVTAFNALAIGGTVTDGLNVGSNPGMSPEEAFMIDSKLDDGRPEYYNLGDEKPRGRVLAQEAGPYDYTGYGLLAPSSTSCSKLENGVLVYNVANTKDSCLLISILLFGS